METWKTIPSLPEYLASSEGRIMVLPTRAKMPKGGERSYGGEPTRGVFSEGRWGIFFKGKNYRVARLICEAFNGQPPDDKSVCMHLDEDSSNNAASNLQWGTQKENLAAPGFRAFAKRRGWGKPKITEEDARSIKYGNGSCASLAKKFGISPATISNIRAGRSWKHV